MVTKKLETKQPARMAVPVGGTDMVLSGVSPNEVSIVRGVFELAKKLKDGWTKPETKSLAEVETAFRTQFAELKKKHPKAVQAVPRAAEKSYDAAQPEQAIAVRKSTHSPTTSPVAIYIYHTRN